MGVAAQEDSTSSMQLRDDEVGFEVGWIRVCYGFGGLDRLLKNGVGAGVVAQVGGNLGLVPVADGEEAGVEGLTGIGFEEAFYGLGGDLHMIEAGAPIAEPCALHADMNPAELQ